MALLDETDGRDAVRRHIADMLGHGLRAYQAFAGLRELAENLRVLSLNAELAAGRAGSLGNGIRALTQMTRELVRHLDGIAGELAGLQSGTYGAGAEVLKRAGRLRLLRDAAGGCRGDTAARLDSASQRVSAAMRQHADLVAGSIERLAGHTRRVASIAVQAKTVATNIAIEAAHAGRGEFQLVAATMAGFAAALDKMVTEAEGCVGRAVRARHALGRADRAEAA